MSIENNRQTADLPTRKQLERSIAHSFAKFYSQRLGCATPQVICTIFANYVIIVADKATTPVEKLIKEIGQINTLLEIRQKIDKILQPHLKKLIQEEIAVEIEDFICQLNLESDRMFAIANLKHEPKIRLKKSKTKNRDRSPIKNSV